MFRLEVKEMISKDQALTLLEKVLSLTKADMVEAVLEKNRLSLTRFAESKIHQNIDTEETILYLRTARDKKVSVAVTGDISEEGIKSVVARGAAMLEYALPDEKFVSFPPPDSAPVEENSISDGTASFGPDKRAEAVRHIATVGRKGNLEGSGAIRLETKALAVANSLDARRFFVGNSAQISATLSGKDNISGWAIEYNPDASKINVAHIAKTATQKAVASRAAMALPDGQYTVILEPAAVGQLLLLLAFMGFGGKTFVQQRSFMSGKLGQKIAGENFTVIEDPTDPDFKTLPFDYEGVARKKVPLIENGIASGVVYNSYYAGLGGTASTGHALPPNNSYGPYPKCMVVAGRESSIEEMIKNTGKGILITHFWYLNFLNPMRTMVTGTTKDGTFLIENGAIKSAVKNMRTNQSILEAFSNIAAISQERVVYPQYSVLMKVPAMLINNFNLAAEAEEEESKC